MSSPDITGVPNYFPGLTPERGAGPDEPRTEAGRFFEKQWLKLTTWLPPEAAFTEHDRAELRRGILAIEAEVLAELRRAVEAELHSERRKPALMRSSGYESGLSFVLRLLSEKGAE